MYIYQDGNANRNEDNSIQKQNAEADRGKCTTSVEVGGTVVNY